MVNKLIFALAMLLAASSRAAYIQNQQARILHDTADNLGVWPVVQTNASGTPVATPSASNPQMVSMPAGTYITANPSGSTLVGRVDAGGSSVNAIDWGNAINTYTASQLGITLPLSLTAGQYMTFTVSTMGVKAYWGQLNTYVTATAVASSFLMALLPLDANGNTLYPASMPLTSVAASATSVFQMVLTPKPTDNFIPFEGTFGWNGPSIGFTAHMIDGTMATATTNANGPATMMITPKAMFMIFNKSTAAGFVEYITDLVLYTRSW